MSFLRQAGLATVVVTAGVSALVLVGRGGSDGPPVLVQAAAVEAAPAVDPAPAPVQPAPVVGSVDPDSARRLIPPNAWFVADFRGDLTGQMPFGDQEGACTKVPPPSRAAVAILPPAEAGQLDLLLAAPSVSEEFWNCAIARIEAAGGSPLAQNDAYQVYQSPSGVVARGPGGAMVFLSSQAHLEPVLSVLSQISPSAAEEGGHSALHARMHPQGTAPVQVALDATLVLPEGWLSSVGQDADKSPLRHITAAFLSASEDGSAQGGVECEDAGCAEVLVFLNRARGDLIAGFPSTVRAAIAKSLSAHHLPGTGRIAIDWKPSGLKWSQLLGGLFGP